MGLLYKAYQSISYECLDMAREKGKQVEKRNRKSNYKRTYWDDTIIEDKIRDIKLGKYNNIE